MIPAKEIQNKYVRLYTNLRNYIWPIDVITYIADLELAVYKTFPDMYAIRRSFFNIKQECIHLFKDDEDLQKSIEEFEDLLNNTEEDFYAKLDTRIEVSE